MSTATISSGIADYDLTDNSSDDGDGGGGEGDPRALADQLQFNRSSRYFAIDDTYSSDAFFEKWNHSHPGVVPGTVSGTGPGSVRPKSGLKVPAIDVLATLNHSPSPTHTPRSQGAPMEPLPVRILTLNDVSLGDSVSTDQAGPRTFSSTLNYPEDSPRHRERWDVGLDTNPTI
jgi:hypothetical protein